MNYNREQLKSQIEKLGHKWLDFQLIAIRSKADAPNQFDDMFYLVEGSNLHWFTGTTNPGLHWLKNPMTKLGAAVLKPGQYLDCWKLGFHRGVYKAWTQVRPVTVYRDNDRDNKSEKTERTEHGLFGINVHRASDKWISKLIDKWSAGCQVFNNPEQYKTFIRLSEQSGLKTFSLTLLEEF